MPPSLDPTKDEGWELPEALPALRSWVRGGLVAIAGGLMLVFGIALWLRPYDADGDPLSMETHRQLGLPPCNFYFVTGMPCPSCGMTTSFALLMHGDPKNSLRANAVGTVLAVFCLLLIPWCFASAYQGRPLYVRSLERGLTWSAVAFLGLLLIRWVIVLAINLVQRSGS